MICLLFFSRFPFPAFLLIRLPGGFCTSPNRLYTVRGPQGFLRVSALLRDSVSALSPLVSLLVGHCVRLLPSVSLCLRSCLTSCWSLCPPCPPLLPLSPFLSPFLLVTVSALSPLRASCLPSVSFCLPSCWPLCPSCLPSVSFCSPSCLPSCWPLSCLPSVSFCLPSCLPSC